MQQVNKFNRDYISLSDDYGRVGAFQTIFYAGSGHGKGMAEEGLVEEWKRTTGGIVIVLADPKDEAEFSFVRFPAKEKYHVNRLKMDGMEEKGYPVKLYHPFSFNIPKIYLPEINFYTFSIKDLNREDWSILAESKQDSATIRLLTRACSELKKEEGLFQFLHNIEHMSESKKKGKKILEDPKNFYLRKPSGNAKSVVEISSMIAGFRQNYFLRKDSCKYKLDWEKILSDNESYHVFLSMWLGDLKLKEFCILHLLSSAVSEIQRLSNKGILKKPVLFVIPEIRKICPVRPEGYKEYLAEVVGDAINTVRSVGRGISLIADSQDWSMTDERIRNVGESFFGKLGTNDKDRLGKALSYRKEQKELLTDLSKPDMKCCFIRFEHEDDGIFRFFLPRHMHKEENYNWIEVYRGNGVDMKSYDELKKEMQSEYKFEEEQIKDIVKKRRKKEEEEQEAKEKAKEEKDNEKENPKKKRSEEFGTKVRCPEVDRKIWELYYVNKIGGYRKLLEYWNENRFFGKTISQGLIGPAIKDFQKKLDESGQNFGQFDYGKINVAQNLGEGIMPEELEQNEVKK